MQLTKTLRRPSAPHDLALVALVVAVIVLMVLPLPPWALDTLIALNLTISVTILVVALYIGSPLGLSTFPSMLLFTTLFRLALNIASTRQILLHGNAGEVIRTFGHLVVGGDVVVGLVVFLIIAIVQFIVIAKGSERIAEVAARFSLDAMPGKQMSIDADLRAGIVHKDEARARRHAVESESQLYGAMDGAMKFVKGDAIAGMIIAAINIVGGVIIGMLRKGMSMDRALHAYSVLAVGDALVSQIPSLFMSVAAGIVITRVARSEGAAAASNLGHEIARQIRAHPKALMVAGGVVFAMAAVPGFPKLPFLALGALLGTAGWVVTPQRESRRLGLEGYTLPSLRTDGSEFVPRLIDTRAPSMTLPIVIRLSRATLGLLDPARLEAALAQARQRATHDLGLPFPGGAVQMSDQVASGCVQLEIHEVPAQRILLRSGYLWCEEAARARLAAAGVIAEPQPGGETPVGPAAGYWVEAEHREALHSAGIAWLDAEQSIGAALERLLRERGHGFIGVQEAQFLLRRLESDHPELDKELRQQVPLPRLADILRRLLAERVSIRDLPRIARALVDHAAREKDASALTEQVRVALASQIAHRHANAAGQLISILVSPVLEAQLRGMLRQSTAGPSLSMPETLLQWIEDRLDTLLEQAKPEHRASAVLLIETAELRPALRAALSDRYPALPVLTTGQLDGRALVMAMGEVMEPPSGAATPIP